MTITGAQVREARKLLNWTKDALAGQAGVSATVIYNIESGRVYPSPVRMDAIRAALEAAGVEFIAENGGGPGVRLKRVE